jgi:hypothetical protein
MDHGPPLVIEIPAALLRRFYAALFIISGVLIIATLLSDLQSPVVDNVVGKQLDLKLEGNTAVWFSSFVLLLGGTAAGALSQTAVPAARRALWMVIGLFFVGLSIDETAELHEALGRRFTAIFGTIPLLSRGTVPAFGWLLAMLPLIVVFMAVLVTMLRSWPGSRRTRMLSIAALACWIGALLAEFVQAQLMRWGLNRSVEGAFEEGFELIGAWLFLISFVEVLRSLNAHVCLPSTIRDDDWRGQPEHQPHTPWPASRFSRTTRS